MMQEKWLTIVRRSSRNTFRVLFHELVETLLGLSCCSGVTVVTFGAMIILAGCKAQPVEKDWRVADLESRSGSVTAVQSYWEPVEFAPLLSGRELYWVPQFELLLDRISLARLDLLGESRKWEALAIGLPWEANKLRLILIRGEGRRVVCWPGDLEDHVTIQSPEDALLFVRLFSSTDTWYRFPQYGYIEIETSARTSESGLVTVPQRELESFSLPKPEAVRTEDGYRIMRSVARPTPGGDVVLEVVDETVGTNGAYAVISLWAKRLRPGELHLEMSYVK